MEISLRYLSYLARPLFVVTCQCPRPYRTDVLTKRALVTPGHLGMSAEDLMRSLWTLDVPLTGVVTRPQTLKTQNRLMPHSTFETRIVQDIA